MSFFTFCGSVLFTTPVIDTAYVFIYAQIYTFNRAYTCRCAATKSKRHSTTPHRRMPCRRRRLHRRMRSGYTHQDTSANVRARSQHVNIKHQASRRVSISYHTSQAPHPKDDDYFQKYSSNDSRDELTRYPIHVNGRRQEMRSK